MYFGEKNFAKTLKAKGYTWKYNPVRFPVDDHVYIPDFYCPNNNTYYEVVGGAATFKRNKKKIIRFMELYPDISFKMVDTRGKELTTETACHVNFSKQVQRTRIFTFWVFIDLFRKVKKLADEERLSASHVINRIVRDYFKGK